MMEIVSACELRPGGVLWHTAGGALTLTVVAKATYALEPVESPLAEHQEDPVEYDDHWDDDEQRSLRAASDLVPFKARADVILVGRAFAPGGRPVRSLLARMLVAGVDKTIEVTCDRVLRQDGALREGPGFAAMPLHWERAAGGPGTPNPVGMRPDGPRDTYGSLALPNLQPPGLHVQGAGDFIPPVGFGPVAPTWPARWGRLGPRLARWDHRGWHLRPLPPDLDPGFFNAAPPDQQVDVIRPDERIVLENLDPDHPRLVTSLVKVTPRLVVERGGSTEELGMRCDTVLIDTDRRLCTLTWRVQVPIDDPRRRDRALVTTHPGQLRAFEGAKPTGTLAPTDVTATLPFHESPALRAPLPEERTEVVPPPRSPRPAPPPRAPLPRDVQRTLDVPVGEAMPALPFRVGRSPLAGTILGGPLTPPKTAPVVPASPSFGAPPPGPPSSAPPPLVPAPVVPPLVSPPAPVVPPLVPAPVPVAPPLAPAPVVPSVAAPGLVPPPVVPSVAAPGLVPPPVVPAMLPAMVAPAVVPAMVAPAFAPPAFVPPSWSPAPAPTFAPVSPPPVPPSEHPPPPDDEPVEPAPPESVKTTPAEPVVAPPPPPPEPLPLETYPLERCAAIAAALAHGKRGRAEILKDEELSADLWARLHRHHVDHVRAADGRGRTEPGERYDDAYVAALEAARGKMTPEEYARLLVAAERDRADEEMAALDLPKGAYLRVQRVWLRRTVGDAELGKAARAALEEARKA